MASVKDLLSLINIKLDKNNYLEWKYMLYPLLGHLDGVGHINGSCLLVKEDPQYPDWVKKDYLLIMIINSTLSQSVLSVLSSPSGLLREDYTSYDLWRLLKELYSPQTDDTQRMLMLLEGPKHGLAERVEAQRVEAQRVERVPAYITQYHKEAKADDKRKTYSTGIQKQIKEFIVSKGWAVDSIDKKTKKEDLKTKKEGRYISPEGKPFSSLVQVCEYLIKNSGGGVGSSVKPSKKRPRKSGIIGQSQPAAVAGEEQGQPQLAPAAVGEEQVNLVATAGEEQGQPQLAPAVGEEQA